jgi:hypothetical protein
MGIYELHVVEGWRVLAGHVTPGRRPERLLYRKICIRWWRLGISGLVSLLNTIQITRDFPSLPLPAMRSQ